MKLAFSVQQRTKFAKIKSASLFSQILLVLHRTFPQLAFPNENSIQSSTYGIGTEDRFPGILAPAEEEPAGTQEPEIEPESEGEPEDWPEPGPEWEKAYETWGVAWEFHIYTFAVCFFLVFVYASYYVVMNIADGLRKKYLSVSLNVMMVICGFSRAFVLAVDPYHQGTAVDTPITLMRILWSLTDPCLTAADSLVILSLLETYKLSIGPQRLQKPSTIIPIICVHFGFVFTSDLVVSAFVEAKAMLLFCQVFFITWCGLLGVFYFLIGYKLDQLIFKSGVDNEISQEGRWYIYLIHASGISNIVTSGVYIYSAAGVFGVYSDVTYVDAWPWWSLQSTLRITELIAAVLVFTVSAKRAQPAMKGQTKTTSQPRKRKMSMFSGMRSVRDQTYLERKQDSQNQGFPESIQGLQMSESGVQCLVGGITESMEDVVTKSENDLERKDSMFTALGEKAQMARNTSVHI